MNLTDIYTLDIGYKQMPLVIQAKQEDKGYPITFQILQNGVTVPQSGDTAKFQIAKPDGTFSWVDATVNADNTVTVVLTEQMLAVDGKCFADITIYNGDVVRSTANMIFAVEKKPIGELIPSQTEFTLLVETLERAEADLAELENVTILEATQARDQAVAAANQVTGILQNMDISVANHKLVILFPTTQTAEVSNNA